MIDYVFIAFFSAVEIYDLSYYNFLTIRVARETMNKERTVQWSNKKQTLDSEEFPFSLLLDADMRTFFKHSVAVSATSSISVEKGSSGSASADPKRATMLSVKPSACT